MATDTMTTIPRIEAWTPDAIGNLIVQPVQAASVATQVLGMTMAKSELEGSGMDGYRVPIITEDPSADWVPEGEEIPVSEQGLAEDADTFHKLAGLTVISSELADDASTDVATQVGMGLARDIARKIDAAFFGSRGASTVAPRGLGDLTGVTTITAGSTWTNVDPFVQAQYSAENLGAPLAAFVANPDDALTLAQLKDQTGSNRPLLGTDPTQPTKRLISGVPLFTSPSVTAGTVWGLPSGQRAMIVTRSDVAVARDDSVFFTSDRVAIRATMRVTFMWPQPAAVQQITLAAK